jgi:hypothetical protein
MGEEEEGWREEGMQLEFDPSAYDCLHAFRLEWPCLRYFFTCIDHMSRICRSENGMRDLMHLCNI